MSQPKTPCRPRWISDFVAGSLSPQAVLELEEHLTECHRCEETLLTQTADHDLWNDAKQFLSSNELVSDSKAWTNDVSSILGPTDDPEMMGRFAGYEIVGVIGRGGMGVVLKGHDVALDRFVAIKVMQPAYCGNSAARTRFAREAQAAAAVVHDNVIAIYGVSEWNGIPFLVMPYIKGESLQQRIDRSSPMSVENTLEISLQISRGLAAAHDQGLVHRDIKPANILLPASVSRVFITDFGLARAADDASLTCSGVIAGTPQYMSPEQASGQLIDARTDLFSLGSVMYAMLTGHSPFRAETSYGTLHRVRVHQQRKLSQINRAVSPWLELFVDRLLEKNPNDRFASAAVAADYLEDCLAHIRQPDTVVLPVIRPKSKPKNVAKYAWLVVAITTIAAISVATYGLIRNTSTEGQHKASTSQTPLGWEIDDRELTRIETEIQALLQETTL